MSNYLKFRKGSTHRCLLQDYANPNGLNMAVRMGGVTKYAYGYPNGLLFADDATIHMKKSGLSDYISLLYDNDFSGSWSSITPPSNYPCAFGFVDTVLFTIQAAQATRGYYSTNKGSSWSALSGIDSSMVRTFTGMWGKGNAIILPSVGSICQYSNDGINWSGNVNLPSSSNWHCCTDESDSKWFGVSTIAVSAMKSTDGGASWSSNNNTPISYGARIVPLGSGNLLLLTSGGTGCYRSTDGGASWSARTSTPFNMWAFASSPNGVVIITNSASSNQGAYSTDGGGTWNTFTFPYTNVWSPCKFYRGLFIAEGNSGNNYDNWAISYDGIHWTGLGSNGPFNGITDLAMVQNTLVAYGTLGGTVYGKILTGT